ncbi:MAG: DUF1440 domain-containing protein [Gemmatimonadota bacterium]|nr:DUF1440 domain-containing protein [Gemmatimonadota bacterium]MDH3423410.1 DUF1440 domain-containing protein [Gemmatimonadota bacterium]
MKTNIAGVITAGVIATLVMTGVGLYVAPMMGMPAMNPADMLAAQMGGIAAAGWAGHLMIGVVLAFIYATVAASRLPGPPVVRGALFSLAPWLMAQIVVMPMMGMGLFSSSAVLATGSLIGHLVYGAVLGGIVSVTAGAPAQAGHGSAAASAA